MTTLSYHKARINSVKWLKQKNGKCTELLCCSNDKTAAVWSNVGGVWKITSILSSHAEGVTSVDGLYMNNKDLIIYTTSIDSTIKIWDRINGMIQFFF